MISRTRKDMGKIFEALTINNNILTYNMRENSILRTSFVNEFFPLCVLLLHQKIQKFLPAQSFHPLITLPALMIPPLMHLIDHSLYLPCLFAVDKRGRRLRRKLLLGD
jgi:hypothetical protein